ncbi:type II secretion system protein N [Fretibacter rubidus]|uniref:type II secretion system protein N n=1 Tax=Fretibacter rubidus TaxID=570162 RepID=UPI00352A3E7D
MAVTFGGTIWNGHAVLPDGQGYVDISTNVMDWDTGIMQFETRGAPFMAKGNIGWSAMKNIRITAPVGALAIRDARLYGLSGDVKIGLSRLTFRDPCQADGTIVVRRVAMDYPDWSWQGPDLTGPISCQNKVLIFNMTGQAKSGENGGGEYERDDINMTLGVHASGRYDIDLSFITREAGANIALPLLGFDNQNGRWQLTERGQWTP